MEQRKLVIIGSGAAGWTAAIYAARAGLKPLVITGLQLGGQLTITDDVENFPGFPEPVGGNELMTRMHDQAVRYGTDVSFDLVCSVDFDTYPYILRGDSGSEWSAEAVIISTGATARWLGVEGEERFKGRGVSACATCDGFFFRGKEVAVVGGGNSAVEESLYLAGICSHVHLIHRRDTLRAERILQDRLFAAPNITVHWNSRLTEICGSEGPAGGVTHVQVDSEGGERKIVPVDGVFAAIGHDPATAVFKNHLDLDDRGYIKVAQGRLTTSKGDLILAAGDCVDSRYRQAVTAAGMGCMAALDIERALGLRSAGL